MRNFTLGAIAFAIACGSSPSIAEEATTTTDCIPTSREKNYGPLSVNIMDRQGNHVANFFDLKIILIETRYADCRIQTQFLPNYKQTNFDTQGGSSSVFLSALDAQGQVIDADQVRIPVPRGFCGPYEAPYYRQFDFPKETLRHNFIDTTASYSIRSTPITGKQGKCLAEK